MSIIFGHFESEVSDVLDAINQILNTNITAIDQLRSGQHISKIVARDKKRDRLDGIVPGKSREIWQCNWEVILGHIQSYLPDDWKSIRAHEIVADPGLLFTITKIILKKCCRKSFSLKKIQGSRVSQSHQGPRRSVSREKLRSSEKLSVKKEVSEDLKAQIHAWLVELQVIPPTLFLHEFLYRIRTGISLSDLINRLEGRAEVIHGVHKNPKNSSYCIANINKSLEYLRKIPKVNSSYLWSSSEIHEGNEEHIYGLMSDIRTFYMHRYPNYLPRTRSTSASRSLSRYRSQESLFNPTKVTSSMKKSIVQWVNALGLERFVVFHSDPNRDNILNGVVLCEVVGEVFQHKPKYLIKPLNENQCIENINNALKILKNRVSPCDKFPTRVTELNEETVWSILWELMNNNRSYTDSYDAVGMKGLEESLVSWIDSMKLLPPRVTTVLELVPNFRNGVLLCKIVSSVFPEKKLEMIPKPSTDHAALLNIRRALTVLKTEAKMSQKYTWKEKEIHNGDLLIIFGLLEDLHKFADGIPAKVVNSPKPYCGTSLLASTIKAPTTEIPQSRNKEKVRILEDWLSGLGVSHGGLAGEVLKEFKTGEKLCDIIAVIERKELEGVHRSVKTTAAAHANIRKALDFLYTKPSFPSKFIYLDDQVLNGNGKVIRSLLETMKNLYKNRLSW